MAEYEINLESLIKMKRVFEEADEDGSGELDPEEFFEKLGPYLGQGLTPTSVSQLFMRIDADCGGTIDWQEFVNYFFLQRASSAADGGPGGDDWRLHAEDHWRKEWRGAGHKEAVERLYCSSGSLGQYVTGGRGGVLKVWNAGSLAPVQTISNGAGWVTDCAFLECAAYKKLVVAAQDRTLTFYDPVRSSLELSSRLTFPSTQGPALCLAELERDVGSGGPPRLVWGDTEGSVMLLRADPPPLHTERQLAARKDFEVLHSGHTDWVTHLQHIPEVGLVSSSLDSTLRMLDLERMALGPTVSLHKKGVRTFAHSPAFSLVASGGVERSVLLWQPKGNVHKAVGELAGHSAGISQLVVADEQSQVITLSDDHAVRVWDLRNHKCVQTIGTADWLRPEDSKPTAMDYDRARRRLVCACHKPVAWSHRRVEVERQHDSRLVGALYNQTFSVVVSGDEGGTICMWNVHTGAREGGFSLRTKPLGGSGSGASTSRAGNSSAAAALAPAAPPKLTAMAFDANQRRLLAASDRGLVQVYNFNSGAVLREFVSPREAQQELTAVAFVSHQGLGGADDGEEGDGEQEGEAAGEREEGSRSGGGEQPASGAGSGGSAGSQEGQAEGAEADEEEAEEEEPNLVLATGWGRSLCVWEEGDEARTARCRRLQGHAADVLCMALLGEDIAATGDFEGEVRVWHLPSSTCLATCSYGGAEFERAVRRLCWLPLGPGSSAGSGRGAGSAACTPRSAPSSAVLAVAGDNGGLQFWLVPLQQASGSCSGTSSPAEGDDIGSSSQGSAGPAACRLVARLQAAHRRQDCITALVLEEDGQEGGTEAGAASSRCRLWAGDSSGHVALWDVSAILARAAAQAEADAEQPGRYCGSGSTATAGVPPLAAASAAAAGTAPAEAARLVHWRAAKASVVSLELLQGAGRGLLLVGGQDAAMGVWTRQGGLVGSFGKHSWDLEDPSTWQDPQAASTPPPLALEDGAACLTPPGNHRQHAPPPRVGGPSLRRGHPPCRRWQWRQRSCR